jgi:hypothetical protein
MKSVIIPQAQIIWDITNGALDDNGNIDPAQLERKEWKRLAKAGMRLNDTALSLAATSPLKVVAPGATAEDSGGSATLSLEQVQTLIDSQPEAFKEELRAFASTSAQLAAAARKRDGAALNMQLGRLNEGCETCHQKFWYPQ